MVEWERTPIGSVSFNDKFVGSTALINTLSEVCDAVYWNRLSYELFMQTGDVTYIDEIERTLYNSLLASFNPEGTWGLRRLRMCCCAVPFPVVWTIGSLGPASTSCPWFVARSIRSFRPI